MDGKLCSVSMDGHAVAVSHLRIRDFTLWSFILFTYCHFSIFHSLILEFLRHWLFFWNAREPWQKKNPQMSSSCTKLYIWESPVLPFQPPAAWCGTANNDLTLSPCVFLVQAAAARILLQAVQQCRLPRFISCVLTYRASACEKHGSMTAFQWMI